jgi:hypothetical protein
MLENGNAKIWVCLGGNMDTRIIKFEKKNNFLKRGKKTTSVGISDKLQRGCCVKVIYNQKL